MSIPSSTQATVTATTQNGEAITLQGTTSVFADIIFISYLVEISNYL